MTRDLSTIVKAYDVRGTVPEELDADVARALGAAFARFVDAPRIVTARDMRESGVALADAVREAARPARAADPSGHGEAGTGRRGHLRALPTPG